MSHLPSLDDYERSDVEEARWRGPEFSRPPRGVVPRGGSYTPNLPVLAEVSGCWCGDTYGHDWPGQCQRCWDAM
jgi:hypothetical protein